MKLAQRENQAAPVTHDIEDVKEYWDARPCNIRHSPQEVGTKAYFDEVEERKYFVESHIPSFADFPRWEGKKVLEIGCGIGTDTINFARHGAEVTAVELSESSLDLARQRAHVYGLQDRIRFVQANAEQLDQALTPERFDLVYSFGVIHHSPRPDRIFRQISNYVDRDSTVKVMVYHRRSWKVLWILFRYGKGRFWHLNRLIAEYSEAQTGCPVTYTYTKNAGAKALERAGLRVVDTRIEHIFPYEISAYREYKYKKVWYFRLMPSKAFHWLERRFGWHLCLTAELA